MGLLSKLFGKQEPTENTPIEFWKLLPFNIFTIPEEEYSIEDDGISNIATGGQANSYIGVKQEKSTHPWIYDKITVRFSDSKKLGKNITLTKDIKDFNTQRIIEYVNWLSGFYGEDDFGTKNMNQDEIYEFEDSINNPDGTWMGRNWRSSGEWNPKCSIGMNEDYTELETTFKLSPEE